MTYKPCPERNHGFLSGVYVHYLFLNIEGSDPFVRTEQL